MSPHRRLVFVGVLLACVATALGPGAHPAPTSAATTLSPTPDSVEGTFLSWINTVRASKGLVPLRVHPGLVRLAGDWAAHSASTGVLALPSCTSCMLTSYGVQKYSYGSMESWSSYTWGAQAVQSIENGWKQHSTEWAKLMSSRFNYVGIGVAYRSSNHSMWVTVFETESKDRTAPWSKMTSVSRAGSSVYWYWSGADTKLQTHTAGLKNFDAQYRVDGGTWATIRSATTAKSLSLGSRAGGHYYGLRVRSRDNLGHLSAWTPELRIWVP